MYEKLPLDMVNIIEEYAKDRTNYDKVLLDISFLHHMADYERNKGWFKNWDYSASCLSFIKLANRNHQKRSRKNK